MKLLLAFALVGAATAASGNVDFEKCFDLATGAPSKGGSPFGDDDFMSMMHGGGCPATGIKFPYNSITVPHARTWWSEAQGTSAALVQKSFDDVSLADVAQATFCAHINDKKCLATSGSRKGRTIFDDKDLVATSTMILQSAPGVYWKVAFVKENTKTFKVDFKYSKVTAASLES